MPTPIPQLPPHVIAKLAARGVTDDEGIVAAMQDDPVLRAEIHTFLAESQAQIQKQTQREQADPEPTASVLPPALTMPRPR